MMTESKSSIKYSNMYMTGFHKFKIKSFSPKILK